MTNAAWILGTFAIAYGLGSIPFGLLFTRMAGLGDIRRVGSGNIGATNVLRSGHKMIALATLLCDASKGMAAVLLVNELYPSDFVTFAALFAVIGHIFPVWLRFKGGKGVATSIGVLFALNWFVGTIICAIWLAVFLFARMSSLSSLAALWSAPIVADLFADTPTTFLCMALAMLSIFTHRANILRIINDTEPTFRKG